MPDNDMAVLNKKFLLLQINDALFPIGSYVHSYGLETYVQHGLVYDQNTAQQWMMQYIDNAFLYSELLAVKLTYDHSHTHNLTAILTMEQLYLAAKAPQELRNASIKLGNRFIKMLQTLSLAGIDNIFKQYINNSQDHCHPIVYGIFCAATDINIDDCLDNYLYSQMAGLINICVKSVPLSQTAGQQILQQCYTRWPQLLKKLSSLTIDDFCIAVPGFDLRSMQHETLYSRLYMS